MAEKKRFYPKRSKEPSSVKSVRLLDRTWGALSALAEENGTNPQAEVRAAVEKHLRSAARRKVE